MIYDRWETSGAFKPTGSGEPFFIPMPPPNITGQLHMGHALFATLQDILIRYHRMAGYRTLWLPGTDHAGLATQDKLDDEMRAADLDPHGPDFPAFADSYKARLDGQINNQLRRTGASCDWSRYRFTLDDRYSKAVDTAFAICQERGMLYQQGDDLYLNMEALAGQLLGEIRSGNLKIIPESGTKTLIHFLENIEPWCLTRQIRWGHGIPGRDDVLDTWFSSALWPFAALGWPEDTDDLRTFYPAALIETGDDILFFWCARMLMMGLLLTGRLAFSTIYLHGLIRDKHGRKMSKSLGNGIDPIEIIERFTCDGMRIALAEGATPGEDMRLREEKLQAGKAMQKKLLNAGRFAQRFLIPEGEITHPDDLEIIARLSRARDDIGQRIARMEIHTAAQRTRRFLYDDFCGWYIEAAKDRLYREDISARKALTEAFGGLLRLLHPFMPFTTEHLYSGPGMLIEQQW